MGHLGRFKNEYRALASRLEGSFMPFPAPQADRALAAYQEVLEILYSPEDAALAARLPRRPAPLDRLADLLGLPPDRLEARLETMCERGIVMDTVNPRSGRVTYMLAPPLGGFLELAMMRAHDSIPKRRLAEALDAYMLGDDTFARELFARDTVIGRALAHETAWGDESPEVLDWERATALIEAASVLAVSWCYCRHVAEHLGRRCDAPLESCLSLGSGANFIVRRGFGRAIDRLEALDLLAASRAAGLVQIADNVQRRPVFMCNCCGCCCEQLLAINLYGLPAVNPSPFEPTVDRDRCRGCSRCARACPIAAVTMRPGPLGEGRRRPLEPVLDSNLCIGCGVCVGACRNHALTLVRRAQPPPVPATGLERVVRMSLERGLLGQLLFDDSTRGGRFLSGMVTALTRLGPLQRTLAHEQVRSRFVRFLLSRSGAAAGR